MDNCALRQRPAIRRYYVSACAVIFLLSGNWVQAADTALTQMAQLQPKPNRCVALHQGQVCYQKVLLSWSVDQPGEYCIYQRQAGQPLHCWQSISSGEYLYAFASDSTVHLQLVNAQNKAVVAETQVEVAWVYKANTRRKTHWRLF